MQIKITGHSTTKLALVKRIKELMGWDLITSKEWVDGFNENAPRNAGMVNPYGDGPRQYITKTLTFKNDLHTFQWYKEEFESLGMIVLPARDEILSELLDSVHDSECKFIAISLGVKYKVVKGSYNLDGNFYHLKIEEGVREFEGLHTLYDKKVTLPVNSTIIEE